jgi:hypothetical protein
MSDINLDFTVSNNSIDFTVQPNDITITPTDIQLSFYTAPAPVPAGTNGQLQYNNNGVLAGATNTSFSAGNLTLAVGNTKITGGNNHYYLQTDGTGNLTWAVGTGNISGNGTVAGANTQIQFNDDGANFGGNAGFTFNKVNGNVDIPGNLIVVGNIIGSVANANYANFANVANTANSVAGANVSGEVANALVSGTVYTNAQPNITSVGTLSSLNVVGTTSIQQAKEKVTIIATGATGVINFDLLTSAIQLETANATANFTLNFRGNSTTTLNAIMSNNESITCSFINKNSSTSYVPTSLTIDGSSIIPLWSSPGTPSPGTPAGYDLYTFNIIKTNTNTYNVFASRGGYL